MSRRIAIRIMLSLLLLLSQQMALSHAMSHWAGTAHSEDSRLSAAVAQDQSCDQCLSFAQLAGAVGTDPCRFAPLVGTETALAGTAISPFVPDSRAPFEARAPPVIA
jgi:hypothetical protein